MKIAIAGEDAALTDLCGFAARRRGHEVVCLDKPSRLLGTLPFTPTSAILGVREIDSQIISTIEELGQAFPDMQIIVTTERTASSLAALAAGASEVVSIPFDPFELVSHAELLSNRRRRGTSDAEGIRLEDLEVDLGKYVAIKAGLTMTMTKLELRLLYCLCEHYPYLASTERLLTFGWEGSLDADPALIKTHISHIRGKLRKAGGVALEIRSRQTLGYELVPPTNEQPALNDANESIRGHSHSYVQVG